MSELGFSSNTGESKLDFTKVEGELQKLGAKFKQNLGVSMNSLGVVASGNLLDKTRFEVDADGMKVYMPYYFDFPNMGVKGVKSSKNAPGSPYQYKNYGMNAEGRASIKNYIQSGKAKISTVMARNDKAIGIGREKKQLSLIDLQTNTLIFLIKKYGIKRTNYFNIAVAATFTQEEMKQIAGAFGDDVVFSIVKK